MFATGLLSGWEHDLVGWYPVVGDSCWSTDHPDNNIGQTILRLSEQKNGQELKVGVKIKICFRPSLVKLTDTPKRVDATKSPREQREKFQFLTDKLKFSLA